MEDNIENEEPSEQASREAGAARAEKAKSMLAEIKLQLKNERQWRNESNKIQKIYRTESEKDYNQQDVPRKDNFNILWANVEIKRHSLYSGTPFPDVRRRHKSKDPVGKAVSEILKEALTYTLDCQDVNSSMIDAVNDMLLPGRGNIRVRYQPYTSPGAEGEEDSLDYEEAVPEIVEWDKYIQGPGKKWKKLQWMAFEHEFTKKEAKKHFPDTYKNLEFAEDTTDKAIDETADKDKKTNIKRTVVYERWNKEDKKVYWIAKDWDDDFLSEPTDDPLDLKDFWPIPQPLYAIEDSNNKIPITEYGQYSALAQELEEVTRRRRKLVSSIRARFLYDGSMSEMEKLFEGEDGDMIPLESAAAWVEKGGIDKGIWAAPIKELVDTYSVLGQQRQELIGQIYELTGISDIFRGDTNPNETLGAQEIKATMGTSRFEKQKAAVDKYSRNLIRLLSEIISGFSRETLTLMTGLTYPSEQEQQMAQQALQALGQQMQQLQAQGQQAQQMQNQQALQQMERQGQQIQQQMQKHQETLSQVNWEQIEKVLGSDIEREYRIDIETNATMAANRAKEQQAQTAFMNGLGQFLGFAGDGMQTGLLSQGAAKAMLIKFARQFEMGDDVEEELEMKQEPRPDPEAAKAEMEAKMAQEEHQMNMQTEQIKQQGEQMKVQAEKQKSQMDMMAEQSRLQNEQQQAQIDKMMMLLKASLEQESLENKEEYEEKKHQRDMRELNAKPKPNNG